MHAIFRLVILLTAALSPVSIVLGQIDAPLRLGATDAHTRQLWHDNAPVTHLVVIQQPQTQIISVETSVRCEDLDEVVLSMPAWRPGRYEILDLAGGVRDFAAFDLNNTQLLARKIDKSTWVVPTAEAAAIKFRYRIYANDLALRTRHVDDTHAFLSGAAVFMLVEGRRDEPQRVTFRLPEAWRVTTGLDAWPSQPNSFVAPNYDVLVDAPFEIGTHVEHDFRVDDRRHQLVVWGDQPPSDRIDAFIEDLTKLAQTQDKFWGEVPFGRYCWLLHVTSGARGGTEHLNSTIMQVSRDAFTPGADYRRLLSLSSHEYFHTWNVKRLRPAGIHPYDYARENYSDLFWVAEGTTSYYTPIMLVRAGLLEPRQYFRDLARSIQEHERRPGRSIQSVAASSFDAWIKFNQPNADAPNSTVSFYREGALVSLVLDMELRRRTDNAVSLDDVMRTMYERFPLSGPGYTREDLLAVLEELGGAEFEDFFKRYVEGVEPLPIQDALSVVGLELSRPDRTASESSSNEKGPDDDSETDISDGHDPANAAYLGLDLTDADGLARVRAVLADGPAFMAGVQVDDLLVTLNGRRLRSGELDKRLRAMRPGEEARLLVLRRDREREITLRLGERDERAIRIRPIKEMSDFQRRAYEAWLGKAPQ